MSKPKIEQKTDQSLSLSPQYLINANILQLNSAMLEVRLYKELESNPALEIIESEPDIDNDKTDEEDNQEEVDFEDEENQNWGEVKPQKSNEDIISNLTNSTTITEQVISSLRDDNLSDDELKIAEQIAGNLDDQGYLKIDPELISDKLNISHVINLTFSDSKRLLESSTASSSKSIPITDFDPNDCNIPAP